MTPAARAILEEDAAFVIARLSENELAELAGSHVLVTGAAGFLPGAMVDVLARLNRTLLAHAPVRITLLGRSASTLEQRHPWMDGDPHVLTLVQDVACTIPDLPPVTFAIHAASPAAPQHFLADPAGLLAANTTGLSHLLHRAREDHARAVLFFSSSEVYGTLAAEDIPTSETVARAIDWCHPRAVYAEAKRAGEATALAWSRQHSVPVRIVRPFHIHGPGLDIDDGRIVGAMIRIGLEGGEFALESDGRATRTYGYVADATVGFFKALLSGTDGGIYNIGTDSPETPIVDLATIIARMFGHDSPVRTTGTAPQAGSPARACPDLSRMRTELGHAPEFGLERGLARTIAWNRAVTEGGEARPPRLSPALLAPVSPAVPIPALLAAHRERRLGRDAFWRAMQRHHQTLSGAAALIRGQVEDVHIVSGGSFVRLKNGLRLRLNDADIRGAAAHVLNHGVYEPAELAAFLAATRTVGGCFVDIGANVGWYSLHAALTPGPRTAGILAFEPVPDTCALLEENIDLNDMAGIIAAHPVALGESEGEVVLHIPEQTGSVAASRRRLFPDQPCRTVTVPQTTLDVMLRAHSARAGGASPIGLIKADVEGAELFVLQGSSRVLDEHGPILMLELLRKWSAIHGYHPNDVLDLLKPYGYVAYALNPKGLAPVPAITDDTIATNFLCLIPGKHDEARSAIDRALASLEETQ